MNSKEALERLGNVEVAVTTIRSGITHFKRLKDYYETEFEVLEKELLLIKDIKPVNVCELLEKENQCIKDDNTRLWHGLEYANNKNAKLKKAIEILKKYGLKISYIEGINKITYILFNPQYNGCVTITQEEYELLKEVLGNE